MTQLPHIARTGLRLALGTAFLSAVASTALELTFGCLLVFGWRVRWVAFGSAGLLLLFALAMASGNPKSPFDYSVFTAAFGALPLATTERG